MRTESDIGLGDNINLYVVPVFFLSTKPFSYKPKDWIIDNALDVHTVCLKLDMIPPHAKCSCHVYVAGVLQDFWCVFEVVNNLRVALIIVFHTWSHVEYYH